jgi:hypothetical protein
MPNRSAPLHKELTLYEVVLLHMPVLIDGFWWWIRKWERTTTPDEESRIRITCIRPSTDRWSPTSVEKEFSFCGDAYKKWSLVKADGIDGYQKTSNYQGTPNMNAFHLIVQRKPGATMFLPTEPPPEPYKNKRAAVAQAERWAHSNPGTEYFVMTSVTRVVSRNTFVEELTECEC